MNVCCVRSAAATQELNALGLRLLGKTFERGSRKLDSFHFILEFRQAGKAGSRVSGPERSRLCGNRNADRLTHLASDRQHAIGFLLTVDAHGASARIHHGSRAVGRRVAIGTLAYAWTESHGSYDRQVAP